MEWILSLNPEAFLSLTLITLFAVTFLALLGAALYLFLNGE